MVVLTIVIQKNGETVFLDQSIPQVHFMKLISCSLYNSWDTLKNEGTLSIVESDNSVKISEIPLRTLHIGSRGETNGRVIKKIFMK